MGDEFQAALEKAWKDLAEVEASEKVLAQRKAQLLRTIAALQPLCSASLEPTIPATLADGIREAAESLHAMSQTVPIRPTHIRNTLLALGFDLSRFSNPLASIHTAMKRMQAAGELELVGDAEFGGGYRWKGRKSERVANSLSLEPPPDYKH
jgi:hypothetical protein